LTSPAAALKKRPGWDILTVIMKRALIVLSLLLLAAAGRAAGQSSPPGEAPAAKPPQNKYAVRLRLGITCGQLTGLDYGDRYGGLNVGLGGAIRLGRKISIFPELVPVARKGISEIPFVTTGDPALDPYFAEPSSAVLAIDYMEVPVPVMYRAGRFHLGAGPFFGFLSAVTERFRAHLETGEELKYDRDVTADYHDFNFGIVLEAVWVISRSRGRDDLMLHLRYQRGLAEVLRDPASAAVRTSNFQLSLSFPFIR